MVALPFPLATMMLWPSIRRRFVGTSDIDVGYPQLTWNVARTILAASSTAVLVSGFPLIIGIAGVERPAVEVGQVIFVLTLVRAPLVVSVMSLQSYLVVRFRDAASLGKVFLVAVSAIAAATVLLLLGALIVGQPIIDFVSGEVSVIPAQSLAIFVVSSGLIALLTVSGAALLGRSRHRAYSCGWLAAAVVSVVTLLGIPDFSTALFVSVLAGPGAGLIAHACALVFHSARSTTEGAS